MGTTHGIGMIGLGVISVQYLKTLADVGDVQIVAVADLNRARAEEVAALVPGARALTVEELLAEPAVDTVLNLTIPAAHADIMRRAVASGKAVFGEKPFTVSFDDAIEISDLARAAGVSLGCAPDTVLGTGVQTARAAIDAGMIGRPVSATATFVSSGHESWHPNPDFYYQPGGGPLLDMGPYYLASLVHLLGPIVSVQGDASRTRDTRTIASGPREGEVIDVDVATHVTGTLRHANGAISTVIFSFDAGATDASPIEVHGEDGSLAVPDPNHFEGAVRLSRGDDWEVVPTSAGYEHAGRGVGLLDFVRGDRRASGDLAVHTLEAMTALLESAESGMRVSLVTSPSRPEPVPYTRYEAWHN